MGQNELTVAHLRQTQPETTQALPAGFETRRIALGQQVVVVDLFGSPEDPPVLLLHGIPGWRGNWSRVARCLAGGARVVAPDLLGFGESSAPAADAHASAQAAMVVALIRQLGARPVHLVGFDYGGPTAVLTYGLAPELVASLTLAATNVLTDTPIPLPLHLVRPPLIGDVFARALFGELGLSMMWFAAVTQRRSFGFARYRQMLRFAQGVASTRRVFQASLRDLPGLYGPVEATLATIRVPCTVVWGERDPFFPLSVGTRTASRIPGATFHQLPGCGHFLPEEEPDGLARIISGLVRADVA